MRKYKLSDFTVNLPSRYELGQMSNGFQWQNDYGYKWNRDYYWFVDRVFQLSPLSPFYHEYMKQLPNEKERKRFKGLLINQAVQIMLVHLENPILQGEQGHTPIVYALSIWRATFIRKYIGSGKNGTLDHMPPLTANMKKYTFTKRHMMRMSNMMFDVVMKRAQEIQPYWRESKWYKENDES